MTRIIKAIIVEDELHSRSYLSNLIKNNCADVEIIGETSDVKSTLNLIKKNPPDLLFLDIELSGESGFTILDHFPKINFEIIFVTAYKEYAVKAFKYSAVSYLLKPVTKIELLKAVEKAQNQKSFSNYDERINYLLTLIKQQNAMHDRMALPTHEGFSIISLNDIIRLEADGSYTTIFLANKEKIVICKNISMFEEMIDSLSFIRIHKSYVINLAYMKKFVKVNGGGYVIMSDNSNLDVSVRKKKDLIERLNKLR